MNWEQIKNKVYFNDGSLRDIYVLDTNESYWTQWIDVVNQKYAVKFFDRRDESFINQIEIEKVIEVWEKINEDGVYAEILIDEIMLRCYFNDKNIIENDFSPVDIRNIKDHNCLMDYLRNISWGLHKHVIVTKEMKENDVLIDVYLDEIIYL